MSRFVIKGLLVLDGLCDHVLVKPKGPVARKVLQLEYDDEVAKFFVAANPDGTQFMLCIAANRQMSNQDLLNAIEIFRQDAVDSGTDLMAAGDEH